MAGGRVEKAQKGFVFGLEVSRKSAMNNPKLQEQTRSCRGLADSGIGLQLGPQARGEPGNFGRQVLDREQCVYHFF